MGTRANDLSRLCGEIGALRVARHTFMEGLRDGVVEVLAGFRKTHAKMAKRTRADLRAFVSDLRGKVANLRQVAIAENEGAHTAWFGSHASRKPMAGSKRSKSKS
jgi:hypothetical protein